MTTFAIDNLRRKQDEEIFSSKYIIDGLIVHPVNNSIRTMPDKGADNEW